VGYAVVKATGCAAGFLETVSNLFPKRHWFVTQTAYAFQTGTDYRSDLGQFRPEILAGIAIEECGEL